MPDNGISQQPAQGRYNLRSSKRAGVKNDTSGQSDTDRQFLNINKKQMAMNRPESQHDLAVQESHRKLVAREWYRRLAAPGLHRRLATPEQHRRLATPE